jgi:hypothetical protein
VGLISKLTADLSHVTYSVNTQYAISGIAATGAGEVFATSPGLTLRISTCGCLVHDKLTAGGNAIAIDSPPVVYVAGAGACTPSASPLPGGVFQPLCAGSQDALVTKVNLTNSSQKVPWGPPRLWMPLALALGATGAGLARRRPRRRLGAGREVDGLTNR